MNILGLVGDVLKTAAKVAGINIGGPASNVLTEAEGLLSKLKDTPEMRAELLKHEEEMKQLAIQEMGVAQQESLAMIASEDKYTKRARPTGLYILYGIVALFAIVQSTTLVVAALKNQQPVFFNLESVMPLLTILGGTGGLYIWKRTQEKMNGGTE